MIINSLKIKNSKLKICFCLVVYLFVCLFICQKTFASPVEISVTPSVIHLDLQSDAPQAEIVYTNTSNQTLELSLSAQNFTELEDGYKLSFLEGKDASNFKYGLSSWIDFSKKTLVISPHSRESVLVYVNKNELTPGGHYGSILAQVTSKNPDNGTVDIHAMLSSLIFVRTNTGREIEKATLAGFSQVQNGLFFPLPESVFFRFQNTGDTELIPYGTVLITDFLGHTIEKGIINEDSSSTLPESIRRYDVVLHSLSFFALPGMYKATLTLHAGKTPVKIVSIQTFFTQGSQPFIQIGIVLLVLFVLWYRRRKRKNTETMEAI